MGLNYLFVGTGAHLDQAFVVTLAGLGNPQNMLSGRDISQNHSARTAYTSLSLVVDVNLGIYRSEHDEA